MQLLLFSPVTTFSMGFAIMLMWAIPWKEFLQGHHHWYQQEVQKVQPCSLCWLIRFLRSAWPPPTSQYSELHKLLLCSACSSHMRCDYFTLGAASTPRRFAPATGRRHKQTSVIDASGGERRNAERVRCFAGDYPLAVRWCVCKLFVCW